ncbi:MAG: mechanosensitive ion channel family protein [Balneolia bacterium]|nr:mechanosensitive ion channel family protein [Balneolia bacterium]
MIPYFQDIAVQVSEYLGTSTAISENLLQTLFIILGLIAIRYLLIVLVYWRSSSAAVHYNFKRYSTQIFVVLGLLLVGKVWIEGFQSVATFLGLLSVGLALALRELLTGLAGWIYIIVRQPFEMGDRIEVAGVKGDIIDKRMFTFSVIEVGNRVDAEQSTGRIIHIPNSKVFTDTVANYTSGFPFIWHEVAVALTFDSNVKKARAILDEVTNTHAAEFVDEAEAALKHAQESFMLMFTIFTPAVYVSTTENGIKLTARYLCPVRKTRSTEQAIVLDLLERYQTEKDIEFAFRTMRLKADNKQNDED